VPGISCGGGLCFLRLTAAGGVHREPDFVLLLGLLRAARQYIPARVLPALPNVVPVKPKLRKLLPNVFNGWLGEFNPKPLINANAR
jgi:hypothetical protein